MDFSGKVALVTGGTSGIGLAIGRRLRERGAAVIACGLPRHPAPASAGLDRVLYGNLTRAADRERIVSSAAAVFGSIDILVNSAGVGLYAPASDSPADLVRRMFDVNVIAAMEMVALARPWMRSPGAVVVNIGSIGGLVALPWSTMYCASKAALHSMNDGLYRELRGEGIHVMLVVPGIVRTPFRRHVLAGTAPDAVGRMRYQLSAGDLAAAVVSGIERRRRMVLKPWPGYVFAALDRICPAIIDWYCGRKLSGGERGAERAAIPGAGRIAARR